MEMGEQFAHLRNEPRMAPSELNLSGEVIRNMTNRGFDIRRGTHGTVWHEGMDEVKPGAEVGKTNFEGTSRVNRAYYTAHLKGAPTTAEAAGWRWAATAGERSIQHDPDKHALYPNVNVPRRQVVHEVEAVGHISGDPVLNPRGTYDKELTADKLKITDTHWVPSVNNSWDWSLVGNQGTFPHVNWNRWGDPEKNYKDYNVEPVTQKSSHRRMNEEWANSKPKQQPRQVPGQMSLDLPVQRNTSFS